LSLLWKDVDFDRQNYDAVVKNTAWVPTKHPLQNFGSMNLEPCPLSRTLKKSQLISRPLPAEAGLILQSGGQVLNADVRWEINTVH